MVAALLRGCAPIGSHDAVAAEHCKWGPTCLFSDRIFVLLLLASGCH